MSVPDIALCWGAVERDGHFMYGLPGRRITLQPDHDMAGFPWTGQLCDTGLLINTKVPDRPDGRVWWTLARTAIDVRWYAFYWWDRSGDKRPNSNAGFYVRMLDSREDEPFGPEATLAFEYAKSVWPKVVARQKYALRLTTRDEKP